MKTTSKNKRILQASLSLLLAVNCCWLFATRADAFLQELSSNGLSNTKNSQHQNHQSQNNDELNTALAPFNKQLEHQQASSPAKSPAPSNPLTAGSFKAKQQQSLTGASSSSSGGGKRSSKLKLSKSDQTAASASTTNGASGRHHLVNKIKDARSRRRRHRQQTRQFRRQQQKALSRAPLNADGKPLSGEQLAQFQQFKTMIEKQQVHSVPDQTSATLTALESIVDEVARAGQQLTSGVVQVVLAPPSGSSTSQVNQQSSITQQHTTTSGASSAASQAGDLQLDGSSSPIVKTQLTTNSMQSQSTASMDPQASSASPPISTLRSQANQGAVDLASQHPLTPIRGSNPLNSRGFFLTTMLSKIMNVLNVTEFAIEMRDGISSRASCMACNAVVGLFLSPLYSKEVFSAAIRTVCTSFKIQSPRVCAGLAESFQDDLEYIRKNTKLTRDEVCGVVFGIDCARRPTYNLFWTVPIPQYPAKITTAQTNNIEQQTHMDLQQQPGQQQQQVQLGKPMNEASLINMEDAPDLFEYRRSQPTAFGAGTTSDPQGHSSSSSPQQTATTSKQTSHSNSSNNSDRQSQKASSPSSPSSSSSNSNASDKNSSSSKNSQSNSNKQAKSLLKTGQFIFDEGMSETNTNLHHNQQHNNAAPGEPILNSGNKNNANKISSFVQITDIHIDPYYETGSLSDCKEPLCCRATSGHVQSGDKRRQAGKWGDYGNCDLPVRTLRSALSRIREQHPNAEYWIWTGDISPHDIWNISKSESANDVRLVTKMVREYSNGLPVFPVIGNHEAHPVNSFSPPEIKGRFSMSWLYELLADEWSDWLPKDALDSLRIGGYYKLQVRKGFRIIALNTNYCARLNPWSFYDPVDPANQLRWLVDELLEAEMNGDKVHIIGHVPPDNRECTQAWLFNFINIVDRFKDTIEAQFYGHTHRDEFRVMYSLKVNGPGQAAQAEEPIGIQFIGPSITPFTENNPAYRIYHQDQAGRLVDAETYFFNLTEANENPEREPRWQFSYAAQSHLNMTGLRPQDWHQYVQKLYDDDELFDSFFKNFYRASEPKNGQVCRYKCKYQILSDLRLLHPYKTKPKPFLANRKTSNHNHHHHHHHQTIHQHLQQKRLRYSEREPFIQRV